MDGLGDRMNRSKILILADEYLTLTAQLKALAAVDPADPRYSSPVGNDTLKAKREIWPGAWVDVNPYLSWYKPGARWAWHTGADLNLNAPHFDADAHAPLYAIADGTVYAIRQFTGWDWIICIKCADCLVRYAHVENIQVEQGDEVVMGQHIANIGNAGGNFPYHLHLDIAKLDARMLRFPGDWPGTDKSRVLRDYLDPLAFLRERV